MKKLHGLLLVLAVSCFSNTVFAMDRNGGKNSKNRIKRARPHSSETSDYNTRSGNEFEETSPQVLFCKMIKVYEDTYGIDILWFFKSDDFFSQNKKGLIKSIKQASTYYLKRGLISQDDEATLVESFKIMTKDEDVFPTR